MLSKLRFLYFALLLLTGFSAYAVEAVCPPPVSQPAPEVLQEALRNARDHGFLWRISKDGRTSFLYGTIHVAKFDWMFPGAQVMKAILATDTIALELDVMDTDIQSRIATGMAELPRTPLPSSLNKGCWPVATSIIDKRLCPNATPASKYSPAPSGPRCV